MPKKTKKTKKPKSAPCKYCKDADEYCLSCRDKIKEVVNTFWWD